MTDADSRTETPPVEPDVATRRVGEGVGRRAENDVAWRVGDDVTHRDLGHGWVQGAGHGVVTVRFETRGSGLGPVRTFLAGTGEIFPANPVDSLDWPDYVAELTAATSAQVSSDV